MRNLMGFGLRFLEDDSGATSIEYAIIAGTVSIAIVAVITTIGTSVNTMFTKVEAGFQ